MSGYALVLIERAMRCPTSEASSAVALPHGVTEREATLLLGALARVKTQRFGRVVVSISEARVVDVEVVEKVDRDVLRALSM
jgi:hypothetical protein